MGYTVRTVLLQNYYEPGEAMARLRRDTSDMQELVRAMRRTEIANQALERELNSFAERGYRIVSIIPHPIDAAHPHDMLITVVLSQTE